MLLLELCSFQFSDPPRNTERWVPYHTVLGVHELFLMEAGGALNKPARGMALAQRLKCCEAVHSRTDWTEKQFLGPCGVGRGGTRSGQGQGRTRHLGFEEDRTVMPNVRECACLFGSRAIFQGRLSCMLFSVHPDIFGFLAVLGESAPSWTSGNSWPSSFSERTASVTFSVKHKFRS